MPFDGSDYSARIEALGKIDLVIELLSSRESWCKIRLHDEGRRCILGALIDAKAMALKPQILLAIEQVTGRDYRRVEYFNDHVLTTHMLVMKVLEQARANVLAGSSQAETQRVGAFARLVFRIFGLERSHPILGSLATGCQRVLIDLGHRDGAGHAVGRLRSLCSRSPARAANQTNRNINLSIVPQKTVASINS